MEAEFLHADGRTDTTKLTVAFRNFVYAPNKYVGSANKWCSGHALTVSVLFIQLSSTHFYRHSNFNSMNGGAFLQ